MDVPEHQGERRKATPSFAGEGWQGDEAEIGTALLSYLARHPEALPLGSFCEEGGWPGPWRGHIDEIRRSGDGFLVMLSVSFEERVSACCDLGSAKEDLGYYAIPRYGQLEVRLDGPTGQIILRSLP
ncbi:MAG: hypothetical protein PHO89_02790 [Methylacidiphilaceae bacterium]|nr:hypothetical protein [Candidatus Methylacidiphilaceae bacterium]